MEKPKGQSNINNQEILSTMKTQDAVRKQATTKTYKHKFKQTNKPPKNSKKPRPDRKLKR
jgi:hypothetical protein